MCPHTDAQRFDNKRDPSTICVSIIIQVCIVACHIHLFTYQEDGGRVSEVKTLTRRENKGIDTHNRQ